MSKGTKSCSFCGGIFLATREFFYKDKRNKSGLHSWCKQCCIQDSLKRQQKYPEKKKEVNHRFYLKHKDEIIQQTKRYQRENKKRIEKYQTNYYQENKERIKENVHKYARKNKQKILENKREYRRSHKKEIDTRNKEWRKNNPEKFHAIQKRRRSRRKNLPVILFSQVEWLEKQKPFICYLCGNPIDEKDAEIDHIIPVSQGGGYFPENLAVTHLSCNRRKSSKTPWEYKPERFTKEMFQYIEKALSA